MSKVPARIAEQVRTGEREPSQDDQRAMVEAMVRLRDRPVRGALAVDQSGGSVEINSPHADKFGWNAQMQDTFGTRSGDFSDACISWLANAAAERGKPLSQTTVNAGLAVVAAAEPANEMEALLAVQMFATHDLSMELMRRAKQADNLRVMAEYGTLATKLSRTMTMQIEALGKLRRGGEQTVRVEHVHVYEGGQAVVGVVNTGGTGGNGKRGGQSYGPGVAAAVGPALLGEDQAGNGVPIPGHARQEAVPHPRRRQPRRAKGQS
jgi:hypothetical protein